MANRNSREVDFQIIRNVGTIIAYQNGWAKELNVVSWNGGIPKYDIRDWDQGHERMNKGITLHEPEAKALAELLNEKLMRGGDNLQRDISQFNAGSAAQ